MRYMEFTQKNIMYYYLISTTASLKHLANRRHHCRRHCSSRRHPRRRGDVVGGRDVSDCDALEEQNKTHNNPPLSVEKRYKKMHNT